MQHGKFPYGDFYFFTQPFHLLIAHAVSLDTLTRSGDYRLLHTFLTPEYRTPLFDSATGHELWSAIP